MLAMEGMVAVVTGGASGIGAAIVERLRDEGATLAVLDRDVSGVPEGFVADVGDDDSVRNAITAIAERHGRIDILVNNAGIGAQGSVEANDDEEWHRVWDVNVVGIARATRAALPYLRQSPSASIVNMASVVATVGLPQRALYGATKGAVVSLTRAMAADHLREGIRVNAVAPGTVDTPWVARLMEATGDPAATREALEERQPHHRLVRPEEVADAVAYLASPRSGSTNGIVLAVDGGLPAVKV
ncbi:SDR family NAD(P)-dependent oxidoreductase [Sinomonas humi]|uniref:Short-chain dehydrogenase n=1 Tax=Sinomonas humi TaxID=1338436 RepID=A0A0B2AS99_9MICC|nr:SDR family oxidoreductase [Sinomonas humi]KHL04751.1 short-chain dehydrogenase [Sinomonas humi]